MNLWKEIVRSVCVLKDCSPVFSINISYVILILINYPHHFHSRFKAGTRQWN